MAMNRDKRPQDQGDELDEHTVFINRCAKTVKAAPEGITRVVVDRGGFKFTGRVAAIVSSAVENGLSISDKPAKEAE